MPTKVTILGSQRSGKSQLSARFNHEPYTEDYQEGIGASFLSISDPNTGAHLQLWNTAGNPKYAPSLHLYIRGSSILLYCIDLSQKIDHLQIQKDVKEYSQYAPAAKIILVGTKADLCNDPQKILDEINIEGISIHRKIHTSAKNNTGLHGDEDNSLEKVLTDITVEENAALIDAYPLRKPKDIAKNFPPSYTQLWNRAQTQNDNQLADYLSAKAMLMDYCKISHPLGFFEYLRSTAEVLVSGHWRHHRSAVWETLAQINTNSDGNVKTLLETLEASLIKQNNPIKEDGSLAKRINFIQQKTGVNVINLNVINETIAENRNVEKSSCSF